jgi:uncharacterized RDD family membrane protein YckC
MIDIGLLLAVGYLCALIVVATGTAANRVLYGTLAFAVGWMPYTLISYTKLNGRTVGKAVAGVHVVGSPGGSASRASLAGREAIRYVSWFIPLAWVIDCASAWSGLHRATLHDRSANTLVVQVPGASHRAAPSLATLSGVVAVALIGLLWVPN